MRGLTILVASPDPGRFHAALSLAAAQAALGARARVHLQGEAVALIRLPDDDGHAGEPSLSLLRTEALALGVELTACQSGLAATGMNFADLPDMIQASGLIELLTGLGDDRLLVF